MVLNRKQKQKQQKQSQRHFAFSSGARKSKRVGDGIQHGGVSPACVFDGASGADVLYRNAGVNIHNTNPQASLDLDNKFMGYGGPVPLGSNIMQGGGPKINKMNGGAANCGDEGRGGAGNGKSETFKQYLDGLANQYMVGGTGEEPANLRNYENALEKNSNIIARGGGFSTDPSEYIAGLPVYKAYDDCCPPAIVNNQLVMGAPDQPVCGLGAIKGGARRRRASASRKHKKNSKRHTRSRRNSNRRSQRGGAVGDFAYSATKSLPAPMSEAFNGPPGVFRYPDDMATRAFDEYQPNYSVNAI